MGYNTAVLILNDALSEIETHPEQFTKGICSAIMGWKDTDVPVGNHGNPVHVKRTEHADVLRVYVSHGNWLSDMSPYAADIESARGNEHVRQELLRRCDAAAQLIEQTKKELLRIGAEHGG